MVSSGFSTEKDLMSELAVGHTRTIVGSEATRLRKDTQINESVPPPLKSVLAAQSGSKMVMGVCFQAMYDSFNKPGWSPQSRNEKMDDCNTEEARLWCRTTMPSLWKGLTGDDCDDIMKWLAQAWRNIDSGKEKPNKYKTIIREATNIHSSNMYMQERDDGLYDDDD